MKPEDLYKSLKERLKALKPTANISDIEHYVDELYLQLKTAREDARTDHLTQLPNYKGLTEILERETARSKRHNEPLTVGFVDFDNLKKYNDIYGHVQANHAIKSLSETIKNSLRKEDTLGRYGGDEFCIILPNTNLDNSKIIADRVLKSVNSLSIKNVVNQLPDEGYKKVTISIGFIQLKDEDYISLLNRANKAMKAAKSNSREVSSIVYAD